MSAALARKGPRCPVCGRPVQTAFRPFCSARCKQVDLNRWLSEAYRVPDRPADDEEDRPSGGRNEDPDDDR